MILEVRTVSAKTQRDGKLEITAATSARLRSAGDDLALTAPAGTGRARVTAMECGCAKGAGLRHVHHFVESPLLARLEPGSDVRIELDAARLSVVQL